jgi:hypothetical protein
MVPQPTTLQRELNILFSVTIVLLWTVLPGIYLRIKTPVENGK